MGAYLSFGAALAAAGVTSSLPVSYNTLHTVAVTVAAIGTNVVVRVEGSNDDSNYFNLSAAGTDTTITANGTYGFQYSGVYPCTACINQHRFTKGNCNLRRAVTQHNLRGIENDLQPRN